MRPGLENDPLPQGPTPTGDSELRALTVEKLPRPRPPSGLRRTGPGAACLPAPTNPSPRLREGPLEGAAAAPPRPAPRHRPQRETPSTGPGRARAGSYFSAGAGRAARGAWPVALRSAASTCRGGRASGRSNEASGWRRTRLGTWASTSAQPGSPVPGPAAHAAAARAARGPGARLPPPEAPCGGFCGAERAARWKETRRPGFATAWTTEWSPD